MVLFEAGLAAGTALVLFLYGIDNFNVEIQRVANERLRGILAKVMANRWIAAAVSALLTSIIQSSTATTVIAVGFVNMGLITFSQSLGIIAGANIGTTITTQLVAFNFMNLAPIFVVSGFLLGLFGGKYRFLGKSVFYFGLVFFSLFLLSEAIAPFKNDASITRLFFNLNNHFLGLLIGIITTIILQSSSVTTGIVVLFGMQGLITLEQAVPIILGANIGTTTTAIFAAHNMDVFAKRTALAHTIFNVLGVLLVFPFLQQFTNFVQDFGGDTARMIANAHLIFNVSTALVFLLLANHISNIISGLLKSEQNEIVFRTRFINGDVVKTRKAIELAVKEIKYELSNVEEMFNLSLAMVENGKATEKQRLKKLEALTDFLNEKISDYLRQLSKHKLSKKEMIAILKLAHAANEIEQVSDLAANIGHIAERMENSGAVLPPYLQAELGKMRAAFVANLQEVSAKFENMDKKVLAKVNTNARMMAKYMEQSYEKYVEHFRQEMPQRVIGTYFTDVIALLESANAKLVSIAQHRVDAGF